jgi:hypothetical protein
VNFLFGVDVIDLLTRTVGKTQGRCKGEGGGGKTYIYEALTELFSHLPVELL